MERMVEILMTFSAGKTYEKGDVVKMENCLNAHILAGRAKFADEPPPEKVKDEKIIAPKENKSVVEKVTEKVKQGLSSETVKIGSKKKAKKISKPRRPGR